MKIFTVDAGEKFTFEDFLAYDILAVAKIGKFPGRLGVDQDSDAFYKAQNNPNGDHVYKFSINEADGDLHNIRIRVEDDDDRSADAASGIARKIAGTNGNDHLVGNGNGNNMLGLDGNDTIVGKGGNDTLNGGRGQDILRGGDGNDTITGEVGRDVIVGGRGNDRLFGGPDGDLFVFSRNFGNDIVSGGVDPGKVNTYEIRTNSEGSFTLQDWVFTENQNVGIITVNGSRVDTDTEWMSEHTYVNAEHDLVVTVNFDDWM